MAHLVSSLPPPITKATKRDVKKVPYVELYEGRLQGVVSSGSDIKRVYVSYFEVGTLDYYCSTNNNRPCGGLRGSPCKHIQTMFEEATKQYGFENVVQSLLPTGVDSTTVKHFRDLMPFVGKNHRDPAGQVFSRFLEYLQMLELPASKSPVIEMDWFMDSGDSPTTTTESTLPEGISETYTLLQAFDLCLFSGFTHLGAEQHTTLQSMQRIFAGSPLGQPLTSAIEALIQGAFLPEHFQKLASARVALQGAQYNHLQTQICAVISRPTNSAVPYAIEFSEPVPLLNSAAHWLMDIAISGFSRLEGDTVTAFTPTLAQLQADVDMLPLATLLTGFIGELIGAVPVENADDAPLFRWADLWSRALVMTLALPKTPDANPVSGILYPLGIDWRQHPRMTSVVVYAVLENAEKMQLVRVTQSAYKVDAIDATEQWLLLPDMALLVEGLQSGKALVLENMPMMPSGDIIWQVDYATLGDKYNLMDVAAQCFAPDASEPVIMPDVPAHQRHPIHLAVPLMLKDFTIKNWTISNSQCSFELDMRRILDTEVTAQEIKLYNQAFGLLRYDAHQWKFQPLSADKGNGKPIFMGKESAKLLQKAPKTSTVSTLQERASRLLRG